MNRWIILIVLLLLNCLFFDKVLSINNITKKCVSLRERFSDSISSFISCSITNSRPIKLCDQCVQSYIDIVDSYKNMSEFSENGTKCIDNFINLDRLQILETLHSNSLDLWNRAKCYECFQYKDGYLISNKSDKLETFNGYYAKLNSCISDTNMNDETLCSTCMENYLILNNYYMSISNENEKIGVCMDMVDLMNDTWSLWSEHCCKYRQHNEYIFLGLTILVLILTLVFYVITIVYSEKKSPTILYQRRFAETLNKDHEVST